MIFRVILGCFIFLFFNELLFSQQSYASFKPPNAFSPNDYSVSYFDPISNTFRVNFKSGKKITRRIYNTAFIMLQEYSLISDKLLFSSNDLFGEIFLFPFCIKSGDFEIYYHMDEILIYKKRTMYQLCFSNKVSFHYFYPVHAPASLSF